MKLTTLTFLLTFLFLSACAPMSQNENAPLAPEDLRIDIFLARGRMGGNDYERHVLVGSTLLQECGTLERPTEDEILNEDPLLGLHTKVKKKEMRAVDISSEERLALRKSAGMLLRARKQLTNLPPPGKILSLLTPGLVDVRLYSQGHNDRLITSVDKLTEDARRGSGPTLKATYKIVSQLRGLGKTLCGNEVFYGVGKEKLPINLL